MMNAFEHSLLGYEDSYRVGTRNGFEQESSNIIYALQ